MKVSEVLQNSLNSFLQNVQGPVEGVRQHQETQQIDKDTGTSPALVSQQEAKGQPKVNLPRDFKPVVGLSAREKAFFEEMFPRVRKEVQAYMEQLEAETHEKGQLVDVKG